MQNLSSHQPSQDLIELKDAIYCRINKAKAILTCVMFSTEFIREEMMLDNHTLYHALWAADDYLEDLEDLFGRLEKQY